MRLEEARGSWALVTGTTSGIGKEFCHQLAAAGLSVVMVARRESLLNELAEQLAREYHVQTRTIALDLSQADAAAQVKARLDQEQIRVRLLCNNAGSGRWGRFEAHPVQAHEETIRLNTVALMELCWYLLPDLSSHPTSVIINVSSQAAYQPVPFMAVYAATKAFVQSFSQALYGEWKDRGVLVQTLVPGPTATEFDARSGAYESAVKERGAPADVVRLALAHLGGDAPVVTNAKGTFQQRLFAGLAPPRMVIKTVARMFQPPEEGAHPDHGARGR
jgi:short-subunit dehydrogenase